MSHPYQAIQERKQRRVNGEIPHPHVAVAKRAVRWTDAEIQTVAYAAYVLRLEGMSNVEAVKRAQAETLAPDRHRAIKQEKDFSAMLQIWKDIKATVRTPEAERMQALADRINEETRAQVAEEVPGNVVPVASEVISGATGFDIASAGPGNETEPEPLLPPHDPVPDAELTQQRHAEAPKDRKPMVRWTPDEQLLIARESKRLREGFSDMTVLEAIRKGVYNALPTDRQRTITTMAEVKTIPPLWARIDNEERAAKAERVAEEARQHAQAAEAQQAEAEAKRTEFDPLSLGLDTLVKALAGKLVQQVIGAIGEHLQDAIMRRIDEGIRQAPTAPMPLPDGVTRLHQAPRDRKPRVLVVGLLNQQANDVEDALEGMMNLDFAKTEGSDQSSLEAKARNADLVVLMTKFISHKHQETCKRVSEHVVFRNGSVSELKRWLTQWINGEILTAA